MKKVLKVILPQKVINKLIHIKNVLDLKRNSKLDYRHFKKHSFIFGKSKTKRHYEADLIFYYHKIEKALALPEPRVGFGKKQIAYLVEALEQYVTKFGWDDTSSISLDTLFAYYNFNKQNKLDLPMLYKKITKLKEQQPESFKCGIGGTTRVLKKDIDQSFIDFKQFTYTRYSIRQFTDEQVSDKFIQKAVEIAQKTPSVCNRQSAKVYSFKDKKDKEKILKHQNGNAGFGSNASHVLIVTMDLKDFRGVIERNQSYIDGGMYAMSLIYALHSLGLGTCPLNLSITHKTSSALKSDANISESEVLIMMIAVGHIPDELEVASSPRRNVSEVLTLN